MRFLARFLLLLALTGVGWTGVGCTPGHAPTSAPPNASPLEPKAPMVARVSPQGRKNLQLVVQPIAPTSFWQTIETPAIVTDRPGIGDRGVVSPAAGVITKIYRHPGDSIAPGAPLFVLRATSERLHASQLELFKATREIEIQRSQRERLAGLAQTGAVAQTRLLDIDNRVQLLEVTVQAQRQDLLAQGLPPDRIDAAARGEFITELTIHAPREAPQTEEESETLLAAATTLPTDFRFELHNLRVSLGQQVDPATVLCELADHRFLWIEGQGFKTDLPYLQEAARKGAPVEVEFDEPTKLWWTEPIPPLAIHHVANTVDADSRVVHFHVPLTNQWHEYRSGGEEQIVWRFRPGDRARVRVPHARLENVYVLPREAVARDEAEAYVFRQNGDLFTRLPVQVVAENRSQIAIAVDGSIRRGSYLAHNGAAALQRIARSQAASGQPAGVHVHADGSIHTNH